MALEDGGGSERWQARLRVLAVLPENTVRAADLGAILTPIGVLARGCDVRTVGRAGTTRMRHQVGLRLDYTFETAPRRDVNVVLVGGSLSQNGLKQWLASFEGDQLPLVMRVKQGKVTVFSQKRRVGARHTLHSKVHFDASLNLLDLIYDAHRTFREEPCLAAEPVSEDDDSCSSGTCSPGDCVAEEFGIFRHSLKDARLERYASTTRAQPIFEWFQRSVATLFRDHIVAVLLYDGVDEVGAAAAVDCWDKVSFAHVFPLAIAAANSPKQINPAEDDLEVRSAGGSTLSVRSLTSFLSIPASIGSLNTIVVPPGRADKLTQARLRRALDQARRASADVHILDYSNCKPSEAYVDVFSAIERTFSLRTARMVYRRLG